MVAPTLNKARVAARIRNSPETNDAIEINLCFPNLEQPNSLWHRQLFAGANLLYGLVESLAGQCVSDSQRPMTNSNGGNNR